MKKTTIAWKTEGIYVDSVNYELTAQDLENICKAESFLEANPKMIGVNIIPEGIVDFQGDEDFRYDVVLIKVSTEGTILYAHSKWDASYQVESGYIETENMVRIKNQSLGNLSPAEQLQSKVTKFLDSERGPQALTLVINNELTGGNGYLVGIADNNVPGYTPTNIVIDENNWNLANKIVEDANLLIYPQRSFKVTMAIVMSTILPK